MANTTQVPSSVLGGSVSIPVYVNVRVFAAATAETFAVPADVNFVIISGNVPFYVRIGGAAAIPVADVTDGSGSLYIPASAQFVVDEGTNISIIPTVAGHVTIGCYSR